jgi:DNA-binding NarL/FixJ family response regulator
MQVMFECATPAECVALAPEADVLVISGISWEGLDTLFQQRPGQMAVLLLSSSPAEALGLATQPLRGWGWLTLEASAEELQTAVQALHLGLVAGGPGLIAAALSPTNRLPTNGLPADGSLAIPPPDRAQPLMQSLSAGPFQTLTERETQVLQLLARGLANKQIALELGISEHTVKFHISSIYGKLGAASRTEAVRAGVQRGLVTL